MSSAQGKKILLRMMLFEKIHGLQNLKCIYIYIYVCVCVWITYLYLILIAIKNDFREWMTNDIFIVDVFRSSAAGVSPTEVILDCLRIVALIALRDALAASAALLEEWAEFGDLNRFKN